MSKIVISGYYGFANAGDEAMLAAIISSLRQAEPEAELTVISGAPEKTAAKHSVLSVHRFNLYKIIRALCQSDLLLSGGGSLLQDVTSKQSLLYYLSIIFLGKLLGHKTMLYAQGIGPIRAGWLRWLTRLVCNKVDAITVRDGDSLAELKRLGVNTQRVALTADAVFTLAPAKLEAGKGLLVTFHQHGEPLVGVAVRQWPCNNDYLRELAAAADQLVEAAAVKIVLLPLQRHRDLVACQRILQLMRHREAVILINERLDTEGYLSVIGNFRCLVGMRLHALIFAAVMHVPFAALSYDPKIDGFVKEVHGVNLGKIDSVDRQCIFTAILQMLGNPSQDFQALEALRAKAQGNTKRAVALIRKP